MLLGEYEPPPWLYRIPTQDFPNTPSYTLHSDDPAPNFYYTQNGKTIRELPNPYVTYKEIVDSLGRCGQTDPKYEVQTLTRDKVKEKYDKAHKILELLTQNVELMDSPDPPVNADCGTKYECCFWEGQCAQADKLLQVDYNGISQQFVNRLQEELDVIRDGYYERADSGTWCYDPVLSHEANPHAYPDDEKAREIIKAQDEASERGFYYKRCYRENAQYSVNEFGHTISTCLDGINGCPTVCEDVRASTGLKVLDRALDRLNLDGDTMEKLVRSQGVFLDEPTFQPIVQKMVRSFAVKITAPHFKGFVDCSSFQTYDKCLAPDVPLTQDWFDNSGHLRVGVPYGRFDCKFDTTDASEFNKDVEVVEALVSQSLDFKTPTSQTFLWFIQTDRLFRSSEISKAGTLERDRIVYTLYVRLVHDILSDPELAGAHASAEAFDFFTQDQIKNFDTFNLAPRCVFVSVLPCRGKCDPNIIFGDQTRIRGTEGTNHARLRPV